MHTIITISLVLILLAAGTSAQTNCPAGTGVCNGTTYEKALFHCAYDQTRGQYMVCPSDFQACNGACFNATSYNCVQGTLAAIKNTPATSASTPGTTATPVCPTWLQACGQACYAESDYCCTSNVLQPGPCNSAQYCPSWLQRCGDACYIPGEYCCQNNLLTEGACGGASTPTTQTPTPTTQTPTPTTQTPTPSTSGTSCSAMFASLSCRTASEDPSQVDANSVSGATTWLCNSFPKYCTDIQSGGKYASCNSVEQLSYAMNLYYADYSGSQGAGACAFGGVGQVVTPSATPNNNAATSNPTSATTKQGATTSVPVVNNPTPSPNNFPTQTADLRIINSCKDTLWFEGRYGGSGGPIPGQSTTVTRALPGSYVDYTVPSTGLPGTRFWAKYGCDSNGRNCEIGDQMQYWPNPPGGCPTNGCTPPVDSLFEATWGCKPGSNCANTNPTTWFDTSQVDGWTIPYKMTPVGDTSKCDCSGSSCGFKGVDASTLDLSKCPTGDDLSDGGQFSSVTSNGKSTSLKSVDLRIIDSKNRVIGCMSPCKKLNWSSPWGLGQSESSGSALWMCCPTPNPSNCNPANGCVLPDACRAGPIEHTQYVQAVHDMAPGVYAYSYDDGVGLHACPAGVVKYTMEFCPSGSSSYPLQL